MKFSIYNQFVVFIIFKIGFVKGNFHSEDCYADTLIGNKHCTPPLVAYHWNQTMKTCKLTKFYGCKASNNNFESLNQCWETARPVCTHLPSKINTKLDCNGDFEERDCSRTFYVGKSRCRPIMNIFHWNDKIQDCEKVIYDRCRPTRNNFQTYGECIRTAYPICSTSFEKDSYYLEFTEKDCYTDPIYSRRFCRPNTYIYYWNHTIQQCIVEKAGGCDATKNNFEYLSECTKIAAPVCRKVRFSESDCTQSTYISERKCRQATYVYSWNHISRKCTKKKYFGCGASNNNFESLRECEELAKPVCQNLPPETNSIWIEKRNKQFKKGDCYEKTYLSKKRCPADLYAFHWNQQTRTCEYVIYGGCNPSNNNFQTFGECITIAKPICITIEDKNLIEDSGESSSESEEFASEDCHKEPFVGTSICSKKTLVYYWNHSNLKCESDQFSHCQASKNHFQTLKECNEIAQPICKKIEHYSTNDDKQIKKSNLVMEESINFTESDCFGIHSGKECLDNVYVYHWDQALKTCIYNLYGDCEKSIRGFETFQKCVLTAKPVCQNLSPMIQFSEEDCHKSSYINKKCKRDIYVYSWNIKTKSCERTHYGGCNPSANNFKTEKECINIAKPVCADIKEKSKKLFVKADCYLGAEIGKTKCQDSKMVWYWNQKKMRCNEIEYSGCNSTNNNFETYQECADVAKPICQYLPFMKQMDRIVMMAPTRKFSNDDCDKGPAEGKKTCGTQKIIYWWNNLKKKCDKMYFEGCTPSLNNFSNLQECTELGEDACGTEESEEPRKPNIFKNFRN